MFLLDNTDWLFSKAIGGVKVQVPEPYLERARAILGIVEEEQTDAEDHDAEDEETPGDEARRELEEGIMDMELHEGIVDKETHEGIVDKNEEEK